MDEFDSAKSIQCKSDDDADYLASKSITENYETCMFLSGEIKLAGITGSNDESHVDTKTNDETDGSIGKYELTSTVCAIDRDDTDLSYCYDDDDDDDDDDANHESDPEIKYRRLDGINSDCNGRSLRKRSLNDDKTVLCPVCEVTLRQGDIKDHINVEIQKLEKIGSKSNCGNESLCQLEHMKLLDTIKENRQSRTSALADAWRESHHQKVNCPVCFKSVTGTADDIATHVDNCLMNGSDPTSDDEILNIDDDDDEEYEEYTWAGQTRVRASSFIHGDFRASGYDIVKKEDDDVDTDLIVDDDDDEMNHFGESQYVESDLIPCCSSQPSEEKQRLALRKAFLESKGQKNSSIPSDRKRWQGFISDKTDDCDFLSHLYDKNNDDFKRSALEIFNSLKVKIKEQEKKIDVLKIPKCLICMESYHKPVASVQCWHVHCEECWLRTLGVKKLCPQCNTITSPSDLRIIFL